ncbi:hypothetical protein CHUAL_014004 [Chamberlinius hualienensis]
MMDELKWELIKSQKGGTQLVINGHIFTVEKSRKGNTYYRCRHRGCGGRAVTRAANSENTVVKLLKNHTLKHKDDKQGVVKRKFRAKLYERILENPTIPVKKQITELRALIDVNGLDGTPIEEVRQNLPTSEHERSSAYRRLKSTSTSSSPPNALDNLKLEGSWRQTLDGREFLLCENGESGKIFIFSTLAFFRKTCNAEIAYMESSSSSVPTLFKQTCTFYIFVDGLMVPSVYILLADGTDDVYIRLFHLLRNEAKLKLGIDFKPYLLQIDFNQAVISAVNQVYSSQIPIKGCHFQFAKNIWTNTISSFNPKFKTNPEFQKCINRIFSLPYLSLDLIDEVWLTICQEAPLCGAHDNTLDIQKILTYVYETFIDDITAKFDRSIWCHFANVGPQIANELDGWNYVMEKTVILENPTIFTYIKAIKKQQQLFQQDITALRRGRSLKVHNSKYLDLAEMLSQIKSE